MKSGSYFLIIVSTLLSTSICSGNSDELKDLLNFGGAKIANVNNASESKIDLLGEILKEYINSIKKHPKLDIVFLIDSSSSVGEYNFKSELKFVKKLLSNVVVDYNHTRIAVVAFSSSTNILKSIDEIGKRSKNHSKCSLLSKQLKNVKFKGGDTFTLGALKKAKEIFDSSDRNDSKKAIFLITDGYSNGGDPVPVAEELKRNSVTIFTIGIRSGNYKELYDISSSPGEYHSYLLDSFNEFESLARRALHSDLKSGDYVPLGDNAFCDSLCIDGDCCDEKAVCSCGTTTGHYSCVCKPGYYGYGLRGDCFACESGTYSDGPNTCLPCPDPFHTTKAPAFGIDSCECKEGYRATSKRECKEMKCPKITAPPNGYYVKNKVCPNVIYSACGIRCEVGYFLKGTSVRLCLKNGTWSGEDTECEIKTCGPLAEPKNGKLDCYQPDSDQHFDNFTALPVDTICKYTCNEGHLLTGSLERYCLPIARWSGLKTTCKPIRCKKLPVINYGTVYPESCHSGRQEYGKVCKYDCMEGFIRNGPSERHCTGKRGRWDTLEKVTCTDVSPPRIICPENLVTNALPGKKFGHTNWTEPIATDNSNSNVTVWIKSVWIKPSIANITKHKFKIGTTRVQYFAQDAFQNTGNCSFNVTVKDTEPPRFENCIDPPTFLTDNKSGATLTWDEPTAFDNSQNFTTSRSRDFGFFPTGTTPVRYEAIDGSGNRNECVLNITVEVSKCDPLPDPLNGKSLCSANQSEGLRCLITCDEGYSIPVMQVTQKDNESLFVCDDFSPNWYNENGLFLSECSETQFPKETQTGEFIIPNVNNCNDLHNIETIKNDVNTFINERLCDGNCSLTTNVDCENDNRVETSKNSTVNKREVRRTKKRRVKVKYQLKRQFRVRSRTLPNNYQVQLKNGYRASLHYESKLDCPPGTVQRLPRCVYCPKGTFHNETKNVCQNCPFGKYNDKIGQTACTRCPLHFSTRRLHSRKPEDCKEQCPPGTHARKKLQILHKRHRNVTIEKTSLKPQCYSCGVGFYQSNYGELKCLSCPEGYTTTSIGSTGVEQCTPTADEFCRRGVCGPNALCSVANEYEYTCNCYEGYVGTHCEEEITACQSQPCINNGTCLSIPNGYFCVCPGEFTGSNCESVVETCLNNGVTYFENNGTSICICPPGFIGVKCEIKIYPCQEMFCENDSHCVEEGGRAVCKCKEGFIGSRCQLLPCDYRPCPDTKICLNTFEDNSTRDSYFCVCPEGYTGDNCEERINHCLISPCLNNGVCVNGFTNYTCNCSSMFYGSHCEIRRYTRYAFRFDGYSTSNFVKLQPFSRNLTDISVCLWIQTLDDVNYGTIISYATETFDNAFTLTDYTGLVLYVNNQYVVTDIHLNDGLWHHVCVTWGSNKGTYQIFVDAKLVKFGVDLSPDSQIQEKGSLILGQDQDVFGGKFSQSESFVGKLTYVDIWSGILTQDEVDVHFIDCGDSFFGTLYAWPEMRDFHQGNVKVEESDFCKNCEPPKTLRNGDVTVVNNTAYYSCYAGFTLNNPNFANGRKCTKASYWEGYYEPYCKRKYCGYPGSIRNGYVIGKHRYSYQDEINYFCYEGYNMIGNGTIKCAENGQWNPVKPRCIGTQCTAFKTPENSSFTIMSDQSYEDYKENYTQLDIGTQIEFSCFENYKLVGESIVNCMENGTWDFEPPKCLPEIKETKLNCPLNQIPKPPSNGYMDTDSFNEVSNGTKSVIEYKCEEGYTLIGDNSSTCILDGYWSEPNISCQKTITCGIWPKFKNTISKPATSEERHAVGDKVVFECEEGYAKLGVNLFIRCLPTGKWSRLQGKCLRKSCGKPSISDDTEIEGRSYLYGDTVKLICPSGSSYMLDCNKDGSWDGKQDDSC
ncbi:unnamed protein product [Phyllotreta striolata]|uniref:Sushi, von Willebrand factor type A, EGF and pentraxin domain-containing protein 1-like n=1 Tax=Phyllotreta striolata TaxID=444603 RepID=A0A9N9TII8_PHYSR|nr:unnamed protein product [Phyllotreta striolata]